MAGEWAIVAAGAIGALVPTTIEWIRERGRRKEAREIRAEAAVAAREQLVIDVIEAAATRMRLHLGSTNGETLNSAERALNQACARLALLGEPEPASRAREHLHNNNESSVDLIDDLLVIVAGRPPKDAQATSNRSPA